MIKGSKASEFKNLPLENQYNHLKQTQNLAKQKLGFEFVTFGAPYNQTDSSTVKVLNQFSEIEHWFYPHKQAIKTTKKVALNRISALNIEYPVHNPSFYYLWNNLYFHRNAKLIVLQGHPMSWDQKRFEEYKKIINYLKQKGYSFKSPKQLHIN